MTTGQKQLVRELLSGAYLMKRGNRTGNKSFALYTGNMTLLRKVAPCKEINNLLKKKDGRFTLNLSLVRQLHGKSFIKQQYKLHFENTKEAK